MEKGNTLFFQIHFLRSIDAVSIINRYRIFRHIRHVVVIMGIVRFTFDAHTGKYLPPRFIESLLIFSLQERNAIVIGRKRCKKDLVQVEIAAGLQAYAYDRAGYKSH